MVLQKFIKHFFSGEVWKSCLKTEKNVDFIKSEKTKNNAKPHQNPIGLGVQIPHPRGIQKLIPHPHGGGDPIPHGVPMGGGGGAQTLALQALVFKIQAFDSFKNFLFDLSAMKRLPQYSTFLSLMLLHRNKA